MSLVQNAAGAALRGVFRHRCPTTHHLVQHLGNPNTTIVAGERYVTRKPESPATERMAPACSSPSTATATASSAAGRAPPTRSRTSRKTPDSIRTCGPLLLT